MTVLTFKLTLKEPVLVTAPGGDPNTDESLNYLPGSAIRGALVKQYLAAKPKDDKFMRLFITGGVRFCHAYLAGRDDERPLPTPEHWKREKDPPDGRDADEHQIYDLTAPTKQLKATTAVGGSFVTVKRDVVYTHRPTYEIAVHNARNREKGRAIPDDPTNRSALFRYHALAAGQSFIGRIVLSGEDVPRIRPLLSGSILLGGSSTAGYGLIELTFLAEDNRRELNQPIQAIAAKTPFLVYLTSDAIVRDPETGQPGACLLQAIQAQLPGHQLTTTEKIFGRMGWVGGFNSTWGLPLPQTWAILKGSIWQFSSDQAISAADIERIEAAGIGDRRSEGFGSLIINPQWPTLLKQPSSLAMRGELEEAPSPFPELSAAETVLLQQMNERIARQELDRHLALTVNDLSQKHRIRLSNSQLARLRLKVRQVKVGTDNPFASFQQYLQGTAKRKSADDQFRKSRVGRQELRAWLGTLTQMPERVWALMALHQHGWEKTETGWQRQLIGAPPFTLGDKLAQEYAIRLIDAICEQAQKGGVRS